MSLKLLRKFQNGLDTRLARFVWKFRGAVLGSDVVFMGLPRVGKSAGRISLGDRCVVVSTPRANPLGVTKPSIFRVLGSESIIRIGADVGISGATVVSATSIEIGNRCLIGADVMIFDTDFHPLAPEGRRYASPPWDTISAPITIGDDVFIGTRAMICKGVTIGNGSVIGAGSIVSSDIPPGVIAAGVPARVIRSLRSAAINV